MMRAASKLSGEESKLSGDVSDLNKLASDFEVMFEYSLFGVWSDAKEMSKSPQFPESEN